MTCETCGEKPKKCGNCNKGFPRAVVEINNPETLVLLRKVVIPASMGDDKTLPPVIGKYHNVLLNYEANNKSYLYSSDGVPTLLNNGLTDYEAAVNLPQINGNTLIGDKVADDLGLQDKLTAGDGIEIDSDNIISIESIEQYAHFFDTVADMKTATNFVNGSYAKTLGYFTKNDGGSALYKIRTMANDDVIDERFIIGITGDSSNTLVAELVHGSEINVLKLGVTETNFADIVNSLITNGYGVYIPRGEYVASETINITKNDSQLVCDGNITGNVDVNPIIQVTGYRSVIKFNGNITATKDDGMNVNDIMWLGEYGKSSNYHNIYIHNAGGFRNGIWCKPDNGFGVAWNKIRFDLLAGQCGILLQVGNTGTSYINENTFEGGRLNCNYGIKTVKGAQQTDSYNGNTFHNIAIDGEITTGIELDFATYNYFDELRLSEGLQSGGLFIYIHSGSSNNTFSSKYRLKPSQFRDDNTASAVRNYFDQLLVDESGNYIGKQFHTQFGKIIMNRELLFDTQTYYLNLYGKEDTDTYTEPILYFDDIVVKCGNSYNNKTITLTLPEVFRNRGIRQFTYQLQYKEAGTSITINDWQGNLIVNDAMLGVSGTKVTNLAKTIKYVGKAGNSGMPSDWIVV